MSDCTIVEGLFGVAFVLDLLIAALLAVYVLAVDRDPDDDDGQPR